jgi:hypothetical protein
MPGSSVERRVDAGASSEAESVALAYLRDAGDDRWAALVRLAQDALSDLDRAQRTASEREGLISRGYIRSSAAR